MTSDVPKARSERSPPGSTWTQHRLGEYLVQRVVWRLPDVRIPWSALQAEPGWAFAWRSRGEETLCIGLGALLVFGAADGPLLEADHGLVLFGGRPFWDETRDLELWGDLAEGLWLLPRLYVEIDRDETRLAFHGFGAEVEDEGMALLRRWVAMGYGGHPPELPAPCQRLERPPCQEWLQQTNQAIAAMRAGAFEKVVLSRCVELQYDESPQWTSWLKILLESREEAFVFALKAPSGRVFMGRSPEQILAWDAAGFRIDAIAGTRQRLAETRDDQAAGLQLKASPKDQSEHRFVSAAIAQILHREGLTFRAIEEEQLLQLKHVQHIRTRFAGPWQGEIQGIDLLAKLHPTPAVGGVPRPAALHFLRCKESFDRGWFAGYVGILRGSSGVCAIGIRSTLLKGRRQYIFAGAGIVRDSDALAEWQETEAKMLNFLDSVQPLRPRPAHSSSFSLT